jgi:hypothetical protein
VAKRNGCSVQETARSIPAVAVTGPLGVTKINLTIELLKHVGIVPVARRHVIGDVKLAQSALD